MTVFTGIRRGNVIRWFGMAGGAIAGHTIMIKVYPAPALGDVTGVTRRGGGNVACGFVASMAGLTVPRDLVVVDLRYAAPGGGNMACATTVAGADVTGGFLMTTVTCPNHFVVIHPGHSIPGQRAVTGPAAIRRGDMIGGFLMAGSAGADYFLMIHCIG